jgi:signal peptidase I
VSNDRNVERMPPPSSDPRSEPVRPTYHRASRRSSAAWIALLITVTVVYPVLRWRPFRVEISGRSMAPTLEPGDQALAVRARRVRRGDLVVLEHPRRPGFELVKRVTAVGGDLAPDGRILGHAELWVQGDAPDGSTDSRSFGAVDRGSAVARLRLVYWPPARSRLL